MRVRTSHVLFSVCLIASAACGRAADEQPPVAAPSVSLSSDRAAIGSPIRMTYRFEPTDRKIAGDFLVFVHVLDEDGERMWGDDHRPPVPTSSWQAGKPVEYSRTVFVPNYPYIGPAQIRIGLYQPSTGERLPLAAKEASMREYVVASVQIQPQSDNIFLIYKDGWHPTETQPQDPTVEWQWTHKTATVSFRNPKKDSTLYLQYDARTDLFTPPQQVAVRIADQVVGTFTADSREAALVTMPITASQLGTGDVTELVLDVDRTFQPGTGDTRELGIRVFHAFIAPKPATVQ
jgi:hypothetical protein